jgi:hypothetical protein
VFKYEYTRTSRRERQRNDDVARAAENDLRPNNGGGGGGRGVGAFVKIDDDVDDDDGSDIGSGRMQAFSAVM